MTDAADWLAERGVGVPTRLLARVMAELATLSAGAGQGVPAVSEALLTAGERLVLAAAWASPDRERRAALDLLAADACVTWALESATDDAAAFPGRASLTLRRLAGSVA